MAEENFVSDVVDKLKKQGLFDRFRKECLADVDTKPAYQNLQIRVKEAVGKYLHGLKWKADLNKNQLRESLRRHLNELPMLTNGIDRVVDQVVKPKIMKSLKPQIDKVVCEHMNIDYEQWLLDQNDPQKKKHSKAEDVTICTSHSIPSNQIPRVAPSLPPLAPPVQSSDPPIELQLPPPPPPPDSEVASDVDLVTSLPDPPLPPCPPPPLPSDASEDDASIPAPPPDPDVCPSASFPPLPPDDDNDDDNINRVTPPMVRASFIAGNANSAQEEVCAETCTNNETFASEFKDQSHFNSCSNELSSEAEVCAVDGSIKDLLDLDISTRISNNKSMNDSNFSNDMFLSMPNVNSGDAERASKEYRFSWNNFHESDLSNISVSSVHTSDLSNFEEDEENCDESFDVHRDEYGESKNISNDADLTKDGMSADQTDASILESLDASNISITSSDKRKSKKEELKERKMEMKRRRIFNKRYCNEEFMSIFNDKKHFLKGDQNKPLIEQNVTESSMSLCESKMDAMEDIAEEFKKEDKIKEIDNAYSPYSNISEASSDSVVVVGIEPAVTKKRKKSKTRKRSRSSDGSRRKKKRRKHKSSRRSSRQYSGDEDFRDNARNDEDQKFNKCKQDICKGKSLQYEFDITSKICSEDEYVPGHLDEGLFSDDPIQNKKMKKSVNRINFGEAERQAAALRMTGNKSNSYPLPNPTWQKQNFNASSRSTRQHSQNFVNQQNILAMVTPSTSKRVQHIPGYSHHATITQSIQEPQIFDRVKYSSETDEQRPRSTIRKSCLDDESGGIHKDNKTTHLVQIRSFSEKITEESTEVKKQKRTRQEEIYKHSKSYNKQTKLISDHFNNEDWVRKRQKNLNDKRSKR